MSLIQSSNLLKLSLIHWPIAKNKLKHWLNKKLNPNQNFPSLVRFFLFYGCNLKCQMCGQWGECGTSKNEEIKNFIPLEKLKYLVDEIAPHNSEIYLWGGEPTLHPNFSEFIKYLKQKKLAVTINTNGILLEKYADDILNNKIDSLDISLIGTKDIHDQIVGVPNSFETVMRGLRIIQEKSTEYNFKPLIKTIITLNNSNLNCLEELLNLLEKNPTIDLSIIQLGWFTTPEVGESYAKRMLQDFNLTATSWQGFLNNFTSNYTNKVQNLIAKVRQNKNYHKPILFFPNLKTKNMANYYLDHKNNFEHPQCFAVEREIDIRHNGDVVICADYPDYIIGNLNQETIQQVWQGEKLNKFRANLKANGLLPICSRCCGLFR